MSERLTLPVLPLREVVLFPGVTAPIGAGRPATLRAIEAALATPERLVFAVSQRPHAQGRAAAARAVGHAAPAARRAARHRHPLYRPGRLPPGRRARG